MNIWSGLLAYKTPNSGRHQLAHLAIHVLSIVANSAGCERLFSEMGNIHNKRHARLGHEKVFDTAIVRMELKRKHAAEGLTRARLKRQFGGLPVLDVDSTTHTQPQGDQHDETVEEIGEDAVEDDPAASDITALAARLLQDVVDDEDPPESEEDELPLPTNVQHSTQLPRRVRLFFGTQEAILLRDLFNYEAPEPEGQGLDVFMSGGLANLTKELEIFDLATREKHTLLSSSDVNT